jgi:hypothetical protein
MPSLAANKDHLIAMAHIAQRAGTVRLPFGGAKAFDL